MTGVTQSKTGEAPVPRRAQGGVRALLDVMLCLYIAVILFRTFELEGYIISTGSMAPSLLGFHKRIVCPSCGYPFAFGIAVDASGTAADTTGSESLRDAPGQVRCPNCGQDAIDAGSVPPNYGDQLLVQKNVYEFRRPRRWEVVVLNGPVRPTPPFVKRVVGLPNESVQIVDGDIYADGKICRKDLDQQRAVRISVFDNDYIPKDRPDGCGDWVIEPSRSPWRAEGHRFAVSIAGPASVPNEAQDGISWLSFERWTRHGGVYTTEVPLDASARDVHLSTASFPQLRFDSRERRLVCIGALDRTERDRLFTKNSTPKVRAAIGELYERSHQGPVTDDYGYNRANSGLVPLRVRDVMLACDVAFDSDAGEMLFEIGDGRQAYRLTIDRLRKEAQLTATTPDVTVPGAVRGHRRPVSGGLSAIANRGEPLRRANLPEMLRGRTFRIELSIFDRQVIAAIDGTPLFPGLECDAGYTEPPRIPLRIGARGAAVQVSALKVYRDIHYTRGQGRNGVDRPIRLAADEYFVLGDNSPVSNDGRSWTRGAVRESQLIGKPLVVHLPSRPGEFTIGGHTRYIRIPDFSRMRYIR